MVEEVRVWWRLGCARRPQHSQIEPNFFLVVRLVLNNISMKFEVNRSMFTGSTVGLNISAYARAGAREVLRPIWLYLRLWMS